MERLRKLLFLITIVCFSLCVHGNSYASIRGNIQKGNEFFEEGEYDKASDLYRKVLEKDDQLDIANYNLGTAAYKSGKYSEAVGYFEKSLLTEEDELKDKIYYNLGNSLYYKGIALEDKKIKDAIANLEKSLQAYDKIKRSDVIDQDLEYNYEFVQKELERLKSKQQQQQQQKQNQKQDRKQDQKQNQSQDNQQNKQNQQNEQSQQDQNNQSQDQESKQNQGNQNEQLNKDEQDSTSDTDGENKDNKKNLENQTDNQDESSVDQQKDQEQSDSEKSDVSDQSKDSKDQNGTSQGSVSYEELTEEEAKMLLEDYIQSEQPQKLLNFAPKENRYQPVLKDW